MNQYRHNQLRERLRSSGVPIVRDVATWLTDPDARKRIEQDPKRAVLAAGEALAPCLAGEAFEVLSPCFRRPLGEMRLRAYLESVLPATPIDPATSLREQNAKLYGALVHILAKCEPTGLLTATELAFYKKILDGAK